jgi:hypothetical protein
MQNSLCVEDDSSKVGSRLSKFNLPKANSSEVEQPARKRDAKGQRKRTYQNESTAI